MILRSLLFVPADRPDRFPKAMASPADALILDLEDSVSLNNKAIARQAIAKFLETGQSKPIFVRINPLGSGLADDDLAETLSGQPDGIVLPKSEGAESVSDLVARMGDMAVPILALASETPSSIFGIGTYRQVSQHLAGLTWGAEDLPASIGASTARLPDGRYTSPYEMARNLTLFGAHAAGVPAIETVFPDIKNLEGLAAYVARGRRDGFTGMLAIHPSQCEVINAGFTPSAEEIAHAQAVVDAFAENPGAGVLQLDGKMIDAPHLLQAQRLLQIRQDIAGQTAEKKP